MKDNIRYLFYPETIAVIGASSNPAKWGFTILNNIITGGYKGKVYGVNPRADTIYGVKCYNSVKEIPNTVDLAVIAIPREKVFDAVKDCAEKGVKAVMIITSGFSEAGKEYAELEYKIAEFGREHSLPIAGPNGQGVFNAFINLSATMSFYSVKPAKVSFVSQSGNMGNTVISWAKTYRMGFGKFISSGNEGLLRTEDYYEYFANDPDTDIILSYIEGVDDGRRYFEVLRKVSMKKPVIVLKGGKTEEGKRAAESHTGSMGGSYEIFKAAFKQCGAIVAENTEEMCDYAFAFLTQPLPQGRRVGAVSEGGGWAVLVSDAVANYGLELINLPEEIKREIDKLLPFYWSRNNPVDLVAEREEGVYEKVCELLISSPHVDIFMSLGVGYMFSGVFKVKRAKLLGEEMKAMMIDYISKKGLHQVENLVELWRRWKKPVICASDVMLTDEWEENKSITYLLDNGIFVYPTPERAARAASALYRYSMWRRVRGDGDITKG